MSKTNVTFVEIRVQVQPDEAYKATLAKMESDEGAKLYQDNPGFVAIAQAVGYDSPHLRDAASKLKKQEQVWDRVVQAGRYMQDIGLGLSSAGRANAIIVNAVLCTYQPRPLEERQLEIWNGHGKSEKLITPEGVVNFFNAAGKTKLQMPKQLRRYGTRQQTAAQVFGQSASDNGTPDTNAISTICAMAQQDTLTPMTLRDTFAALGHEAARIEDLPSEAQSAFTPAFRLSQGSAQNGRQQAAQPS